MPHYITKTLEKLNHKAPRRPQHAPHKWIHRTYGAKAQLATIEKDLPPLSSKETKYIQKVVGCFLYYGRAVDLTILPTVNKIAIDQSKPTVVTMDKVRMLLDYLATHP